MTVLLCPLCSHPRFNNLESLRLSLINAATQNISCPICNDVLMGLDKLTIHLFGHTFNQNIVPEPQQPCLQLKTLRRSEEEAQLSCQTPEMAKPGEQSQHSPDFLSFLQADRLSKMCEKAEDSSKEYFKDIESCYDLELTKPVQECEEKDSSLCTVNMEDLSFLTSWENSVKLKQDLKDAELSQLSPKSSWCLEREEMAGRAEDKKEDSTELSEYMSELLNKKLPILNFVFTMDGVDKGRSEPGLEKKPLKCGTCGFTFQNPIILSMHEELVHSKPKMCVKMDEHPAVQPEGSFSVETERPVAFVATPSGLLENDPELPHEPPGVIDPGGSVDFILTPTLGFAAKTEEHLEAEDCKDVSDARYNCHLCPKSFRMKGSLLVHFRVAHFGLNLPENGPVLGSPGSPEERNFHCTICSKSFKKEQHLTQHIKTHEGKQWQCETCSKHFTTKYFLKKHQRLHTGEMPYSCPACKKTFTFQQSYHKHLLYHSDEKPHQCTECGRSFKELSTLHNHQRIHSGEKPFACETCGKCFRQRVSYIVHQRIHTGVLPYQCTACKKKFRYKVSQRSHKCTAQPPGIVVRQPGDLIQRILEHRSDILQCSE